MRFSRAERAAKLSEGNLVKVRRLEYAVGKVCESIQRERPQPGVLFARDRYEIDLLAVSSRGRVPHRPSVARRGSQTVTSRPSPDRTTRRPDPVRRTNPREGPRSGS